MVRASGHVDNPWGPPRPPRLRPSEMASAVLSRQKRDSPGPRTGCFWFQKETHPTKKRHVSPHLKWGGHFRWVHSDKEPTRTSPAISGPAQVPVQISPPAAISPPPKTRKNPTQTAQTAQTATAPHPPKPAQTGPNPPAPDRPKPHRPSPEGRPGGLEVQLVALGLRGFELLAEAQLQQRRAGVHEDRAPGGVRSVPATPEKTGSSGGGLDPPPWEREEE